MASKRSPVYLIIPDLQIPFELDNDSGNALLFCKYLVRHYKIQKENIYCVGDETDQYNFSTFNKDPDGYYTPGKELQITKEKLKMWSSAFPRLKICTSNHGIRWQKRAMDAQLPRELLKSVQDVLDTPPGWEWKKKWKVSAKHPFIVEHGDDWGGKTPHKTAALYNSCSTVMGHHHALAGIEFINTNGLDHCYGFVTGSLIDVDAYAFQYAKRASLKPLIGAGIIFNDGKVPVWIPISSF